MTINKSGRGVASYSSNSGSHTESGLTANGVFYTLTAETEHYPRWVWSNSLWTATYEYYTSWYTTDEEGKREYHESEHETRTVNVYGSPCAWEISGNKMYLMTGTIEGRAPAIELVDHIDLQSVLITFAFYSTDNLLYDNSQTATGKLVCNSTSLVYGGQSSSS